MIKAVLFDLDMTLVDSKEVGLNVRKSLIDEGIDFGDMTEEKMWNVDFKEFCKLLADFNPNLTEEQIQDKDLFYMLQNYSKLKINEIDFLKKLKSKIKIGIITSNRSEVLDCVLNNNTIEFDFTSSRHNHDTKSEALLDFIQKNNLKAKEVIYVEDHPTDIIAAKSAGVISAGVSTGYHTNEELLGENPDILINNIKEVENYVFTYDT